MILLRSFTYIFGDRHWRRKMAELALFLILCPLPVVGILCLCALLGYLAALVRNVSNDYPRPLPTWTHIGEDIGKGFPVLVAILVYHLPLLLALLLLSAARGSLGGSLFGGLTFVGILTGLAPLLLLYLAFAWSLLALGMTRYAETWEWDAFFQLNALLRSLQANSMLTLQWLIVTAAACLLLIALLPAALLGLLLFVPVQGYVTGTYGRRLRGAKFAYRQGRA